MNKLRFSPLRDSYAPKLGDDVTTTSFISGLPRQRLTKSGVPTTSQVGFQLSDTEFDEFMNFYFDNRTTPFLMELFAIDSKLYDYECRFLNPPESRQLAYKQYQVSVSIVIGARPYVV